MDKQIVDLPASGALVGTTIYETQLTGGGASQKATHTQMLAFIQGNATSFSQSVNFAGPQLSVGGVNFIVSSNGSVSVGNANIELHADGSAAFGPNSDLQIAADGAISINGGNVGLSPDGSAFFSVGIVLISAGGDVEISDTTKGFILKSSGGNRFRIKVDDGGNLGTEPA